mgnify:CR=1 FL=1
MTSSNEIIITLLGDISLNGVLSENSNHLKEHFSDILPYFSENTMVFANLEAGLKGSHPVPGKFTHFASEESLRILLPLLHVQVLSLANNHTFDFGAEGLKKTIRLLDELTIRYCGAGTTKQQKFTLIEKQGFRIGFLAYVHHSTHPALPSDTDNVFINIFSVETVIADIQQVKKHCHCIIVSVHWGDDYSFFPTKQQKQDARLMIDAGADIIAGHHPHTIQPYEKYKNGHIFYSLGSLCYGEYKNHRGLMVSLPKKTKKSYIIQLRYPSFSIQAIPVQEKKQNYLTTDSGNFFLWSKKILSVSALIERWPVLYFFVICKEKIADRIYEFFFGYYPRGYKEFFSFYTFVRIKKLMNRLFLALRKQQ